jgi:hypothetical protein
VRSRGNVRSEDFFRCLTNFDFGYLPMRHQGSGPGEGVKAAEGGLVESP